MKKILAANLISGISLVTLIVFGVNYLIFKNSPIYTNYTIEIINNPVTGNEDIEFAMVGTKILDCTANNVYGTAHNEHGHEFILNEYTRAYIRAISPGETVTNRWAYRKPADMHPGVYRVTMKGDWTCRFWIFDETKLRQYDNILLIVE